MYLNEQWLQRAMSFDEYLEKADMNVPTMKEHFEDTKVSDEVHQYFTWVSTN